MRLGPGAKQAWAKLATSQMEFSICWAAMAGKVWKSGRGNLLRVCITGKNFPAAAAALVRTNHTVRFELIDQAGRA
jgi:hypothetical protein